MFYLLSQPFSSLMIIDPQKQQKKDQEEIKLNTTVRSLLDRLRQQSTRGALATPSVRRESHSCPPPPRLASCVVASSSLPPGGGRGGGGGGGVAASLSRVSSSDEEEEQAGWGAAVEKEEEEEKGEASYSESRRERICQDELAILDEIECGTSEPLRAKSQTKCKKSRKMFSKRSSSSSSSTTTPAPQASSSGFPNSLFDRSVALSTLYGTYIQV